MNGARVIVENIKGNKLFEDITIKIISADIVSKEIKAIII